MRGGVHCASTGLFLDTKPLEEAAGPFLSRLSSQLQNSNWNCTTVLASGNCISGGLSVKIDEHKGQRVACTHGFVAVATGIESRKRTRWRLCKSSVRVRMLVLIKDFTSMVIPYPVNFDLGRLVSASCICIIAARLSGSVNG